MDEKLKSDSHVTEDTFQIKIFPSLVRKNTNICLVGILKMKRNVVLKSKFCFLEKQVYFRVFETCNCKLMS